jgi:hypothetical protein
MCQYILATFPVDADLAALERVFVAHKRGWEVLTNPHLARQLPARDVQVLTTAGHCDCGSGLGSQPPAVDDPERQVPKLRKKGWGEAKIRRWLDERKGAAARNERINATRGRPVRADWCAIIEAALAHTSRFGLFVHEYRSGVANERVDVRRESVPRSALDEDWLDSVEEDVVYEVAR